MYNANAEPTVDFLVRLSVVNIPGSRPSLEAQLFVPDLMEHPRFRSQVGRMGHYLVCNKAMLKFYDERRM